MRVYRKTYQVKGNPRRKSKYYSVEIWASGISWKRRKMVAKLVIKHHISWFCYLLDLWSGTSYLTFQNHRFFIIHTFVHSSNRVEYHDDPKNPAGACSLHCFYNFSLHRSHLQRLLTQIPALCLQISGLVALGWGHRICVSSKFPDAADAAGPGTTLSGPSV